MLACGGLGGLVGAASRPRCCNLPRLLPGTLRRLSVARPAAFAARCRLLLAAIGWCSGGTDYEQAWMLVEGQAGVPLDFSHLEVAGHGGVLAERHPRRHLRTFLVDRRRIGQRLAGLLPLASVGAPGGTVVLLGMAAYFSRVVQAPITAAVTVLEMTSNHPLAVPLMATSPVAFVASRLVCRRPFYSSMARRFLKH